MNIHQEELRRKLSSVGCKAEFDEEFRTLSIEYGDFALGFQDTDGVLHYTRDMLNSEANEKLDEVIDLHRKIKEYTSKYLNAPHLPFDDVKEYRLLAEYGDTILAANNTEQGFMFCTWEQDKKHSYVTRGDYTTDYDYAKRSFATRSGLVDKHRLFSLEEATNIYKCIQYAKDNCETLDYDQEQQLKGLLDNLKFGYEQLEESPPSFEEANIPQLNM